MAWGKMASKKTFKKVTNLQNWPPKEVTAMVSFDLGVLTLW